MRKILLLFVLVFSLNLHSQTFIKFNPVPAFVGAINLGVETAIGKKMTFSFDMLASPWDYDGKPRKFCFFVPELRYHFTNKYNGFYFGGHFAFQVFNAQKWTYKKLGIYEKGMGYLLGGTLGYQLPVAKKWNLDFFVGGGWQEGYYKGYNIKTGIRTDGATHWNISGDWYFYRGGIMVSYKL